MREKCNELLERIEDQELTVLELTLMIAVAFLSGLVLGMIFSPKKHVVIGSNNGNNSPGCLTLDTTDEDEEDEAAEE